MCLIAYDLIPKDTVRDGWGRPGERSHSHFFLSPTYDLTHIRNTLQWNAISSDHGTNSPVTRFSCSSNSYPCGRLTSLVSQMLWHILWFRVFQSSNPMSVYCITSDFSCPFLRKTRMGSRPFTTTMQQSNLPAIALAS